MSWLGLLESGLSFRSLTTGRDCLKVLESHLGYLSDFGSAGQS